MGKLVLITDSLGRQIIGEAEAANDLLILNAAGLVEIKKPLLFAEVPEETAGGPEFNLRVRTLYYTLLVNEIQVKPNSVIFIDGKEHNNLQKGYGDALSAYGKCVEVTEESAI